MADNHNFKTIVRILEYRGTQEWLEKTMAASRMPIQGIWQQKDGSYIKGGVIVWQPDKVTEAQVEDSNNKTDDTNPVDGQPSVELQAAIENAKVAIFKRPGE